MVLVDLLVEQQEALALVLLGLLLVLVPLVLLLVPLVPLARLPPCPEPQVLPHPPRKAPECI